VQMGMLNLSHVASDCAFPTTCPGVADNLPRHYKFYRYFFPFGSYSTQCITVILTATGCPGNLFSYSGSPDRTRYRADIGHVVTTTRSYSFVVFRGTYITFVVHEV